MRFIVEMLDRLTWAAAGLGVLYFGQLQGWIGALGATY